MFYSIEFESSEFWNILLTKCKNYSPYSIRAFSEWIKLFIGGVMWHVLLAPFRLLPNEREKPHILKVLFDCMVLFRFSYDSVRYFFSVCDWDISIANLITFFFHFFFNFENSLKCFRVLKIFKIFSSLLLIPELSLTVIFVAIWNSYCCLINKYSQECIWRAFWFDFDVNKSNYTVVVTCFFWRRITCR